LRGGAGRAGATRDGRGSRRDGGPLRIGVSACLLGHAVRWDGGHKREAALADDLTGVVEWVPVCPEVEVGMGVPRPPVRLERARDGATRVVDPASGRDWTPALTRWAGVRLRELDRLRVCGYVLKSRSPSCGLAHVPVYDAGTAAGRGASAAAGARAVSARGASGAGDAPSAPGRGAFAAALVARFGGLPVEEEGALRDAGARAHFLERALAYRRLRAFLARRPGPRALAAFHAAHALLLLAHAPARLRALDRLVADAIARARRPGAREPEGGRGPAGVALRARYEAGFTQALARPATREGHARALRRALALLRARAAPRAHAELASLVDAFAAGRAPLAAVRASVLREAERRDAAELARQAYLAPRPWERTLRGAARRAGRRGAGR